MIFAKEQGLNNIDFIEIGGGYGGLCFFVNKISQLFGITVKSYTIFDLLEPTLLQKMYLNHFQINNTNFYQINDNFVLNKNSFLISNYAYSEISYKLQKEYTDKVLNPYTSHGFLVWNTAGGSAARHPTSNELVYDFVQNSVIEKELEYPQTGVSNYYVRFRPNI